MIFNRNEFKLEEYDSLGISIDFYYLNADSFEIAVAIKEIAACVNFYSENIGAYQYKKLSLYKSFYEKILTYAELEKPILLFDTNRTVLSLIKKLVT